MLTVRRKKCILREIKQGLKCQIKHKNDSIESNIQKNNICNQVQEIAKHVHLDFSKIEEFFLTDLQNGFQLTSILSLTSQLSKHVHGTIGKHRYLIILTIFRLVAINVAINSASEHPGTIHYSIQWHCYIRPIMLIIWQTIFCLLTHVKVQYSSIICIGSSNWSADVMIFRDQTSLVPSWTWT